MRSPFFASPTIGQYLRNKLHLSNPSFFSHCPFHFCDFRKRVRARSSISFSVAHLPERFSRYRCALRTGNSIANSRSCKINNENETGPRRECNWVYKNKLSFLLCIIRKGLCFAAKGKFMQLYIYKSYNYVSVFVNSYFLATSRINLIGDTYFLQNSSNENCFLLEEAL